MPSSVGNRLTCTPSRTLAQGWARNPASSLDRRPLGGPDQRGRTDWAHLGQTLLGGNAPAHHPDAVGAPVALLDATQEVGQRRGVRRVAREHLAAQRETLRDDDQRDDYLAAVASLVAALAALAQVICIAVYIALEVGAGPAALTEGRLRLQSRRRFGADGTGVPAPHGRCVFHLLRDELATGRNRRGFHPRSPPVQECVVGSQDDSHQDQREPMGRRRRCAATRTNEPLGPLRRQRNTAPAAARAGCAAAAVARVPRWSAFRHAPAPGH